MPKPIPRSQFLKKLAREAPNVIYEDFIGKYQRLIPAGKTEIETFLLSGRPLEDLRPRLTEVFDPIYAHTLIEVFRWKRNMLIVSKIRPTDVFAFEIRDTLDC